MGTYFQRIRHVGYTTRNREAAVQLLQRELGVGNCQLQENTAPYISAAIGYPQTHNRAAFAQFSGDLLQLEVLEYVVPRRDDSPIGLSNPGQGWICCETNCFRTALEKLRVCPSVTPLGIPHAIESGPWAGRETAFFSSEDGLQFSLLQADRASGSCAVRLHHAGFVVSDLDEISTFLTEAFSFRMLERRRGVFPGAASVTGWHSEMETAVLQAGDGFFLCLWSSCGDRCGPPADVEPARIGNVHLCCEVSDIAAVCRMLRAKGHQFPGEPALVTCGVNCGARAIYLQTPNELRCELYQKPKA